MGFGFSLSPSTGCWCSQIQQWLPAGRSWASAGSPHCLTPRVRLGALLLPALPPRAVGIAPTRKTSRWQPQLSRVLPCHGAPALPFGKQDLRSAGGSWQPDFPTEGAEMRGEVFTSRSCVGLWLSLLPHPLPLVFAFAFLIGCVPQGMWGMEMMEEDGSGVSVGF